MTLLRRIWRTLRDVCLECGGVLGRKTNHRRFCADCGWMERS